MPLLVNALERRRCLAALAALVVWGRPASAQSAGDGAQDFKFTEFFRLPVGPRGLEASDALLAADGKPVRLIGYMVSQEHPTPGRFMLTQRPVSMSEHADGEADDLPPATVTVLLDERHRDRVIVHQPGLIALQGLLSVGRDEDPAGRVSWVRLLLSADVLADDRFAGSRGARLQPKPPTSSSAAPSR